MLDSQIVLKSPYEKAKEAGLVSKKDKKVNRNVDWDSRQSEYCWDTSGPRDAFDAHPLAIKAHTYGSSLK